MPVVPDSKIGKVEFYENHTAIWNSNATALGTTTTIVGTLITKTAAARLAFNAQQQAQTAAKAATEVFNAAIEAMQIDGASIITQIRAKASIVGDSVYSLAQIPIPANPTPAGPPGIPSEIKGELTNTGSLLMKWKNTDARGCVYAIYRSVEGGPWVNLGGTGAKKFTDTSIPLGSSSIVYRIQAVRPTGTSDWGILNVSFGGGMSGMMITEGTPVKAAA